MKKLIFAITMTLAFTSVFANANPAVQKCAQKAADVIAKKGVTRGETTTVSNVSVSGANQDYVGYYVDVVVSLRNGVSFKQVCEIIMKTSNCSYDNTYGCAATLKDLSAQ
jgi:hypothetical protein